MIEFTGEVPGGGRPTVIVEQASRPAVSPIFQSAGGVNPDARLLNSAVPRDSHGAGWKACDTADWKVCATVAAGLWPAVERGILPRGKSSSQLLGLILCLVLGTLAGCTTGSHTSHTSPRRFDFGKDTFAYANGLVWEYRYDPNGKWTTRRREPRPDYSQHCFVVSRSAGQFFENAIFDAGLPKADTATYRRLVRKVISSSLRSPLPQSRKVVFPGYADLRTFSQEHETMLKAECGGAWQCYFQRGNWRVVFPFTRHQQEHMARKLEEELQQKGIAVAHLVRFPQLSINHAVLLYGAKADSTQVQFLTYDPNEPEKPAIVTFDRATRTFSLATNAYFQGGRVDVYPIYDRRLY